MEADSPEHAAEPVEPAMRGEKPFPWAEVASGSTVVVTKQLAERVKERV